MVKRFVVFGFDQFYPCGGWNDHVESFDSLEEAEKLARQLRDYKTDKIHFNEVEIVDLHSGGIVGRF